MFLSDVMLSSSVFFFFSKRVLLATRLSQYIRAEAFQHRAPSHGGDQRLNIYRTKRRDVRDCARSSGAAVQTLISNSSGRGYVNVALPHFDVNYISRRPREKEHIIVFYLVGSAVCSKVSQH